MSCECGSRVDFAFENLACMECGRPCCPSCAVPLESVSYCRPCASALLGGAAEPATRFEFGG